MALAWPADRFPDCSRQMGCFPPLCQNLEVCRPTNHSKTYCCMLQRIRQQALQVRLRLSFLSPYAKGIVKAGV